LAGQPLIPRFRQPPDLRWQRRRLPVCASTEIELGRWLAARAAAGRPLPADGTALVVMARRQRFGRGQQGRHWVSPPGGLWLSAAIPWPSQSGSAALGLAVAVGLALQLEALGLRPRIKWPNDLLLADRKLAGLLPRLRQRGRQVRWAQVGIGLNGRNRVPPGAISLAEALSTGRRAPHPQAMPRQLEGRVVAALAWAVAAADDAEAVRDLAAARLWRQPAGIEHAGLRWQVEGLELDGQLRLRSGALLTRLQRQF
jgi:BirA family transcriptional regulator, biotin operon repressor / biotin---[acetyl-CoA-carboxylase] ligase